MTACSELFDGEELSLIGLNLQAVINLNTLPNPIIEQLSAINHRFKYFTQLILIGQGGRLMWEKLSERKVESDNPVDDFSYDQVKHFFNQRFMTDDFEITFPRHVNNNVLIDLQALGSLVGWHYPSPFGVGINNQWGSWFAYRAVVLVNSHYQVTKMNHQHSDKTKTTNRTQSPCQTCINKQCIQSCPVNALKDETLDLKRCLTYRVQADSNCNDRCIARMACPVAKSHQYKIEQIKYHYEYSLKSIRFSAQ